MFMAVCYDGIYHYVLPVRSGGGQEQERSGILIFSKRYAEEHGGDGNNLFLYVQDSSGSAWVVCKMNMILHGIREKADIQNDDTLAHPRHLDRGEPRRFDSATTNGRKGAG